MSERKSGVLLHISSLPSKEGAGTLGQTAYDFIEWLEAAGFGIWQVLPVGPVGYGESPYQSPCSFAGNPMFIDLTLLEKDGLITNASDFTDSMGEASSMEILREKKFMALKRSFRENFESHAWEVLAFTQAHPDIEDYALFMAVKNYFGGKAWNDWPDHSIRMREKNALNEYAKLLKDDINFYRYIQYLFFKQWEKLKAFAKAHNVLLFGDMPIYVAEDSSDVWANPELFQLDKDRKPVKVAGVPPDYFSQDGQLWGNPLYNWKALRKTGFSFWIRRLAAAGGFFDIVRVDHFIGFANYYAIKAGAKNARVGRWEKAPGFALFKKVAKALPQLTIIAEDLGVVSRRVKRLLHFTGYPGMKVLQFGFDSDEENPHYIGNIRENCVCYTGTHDNDTAAGWWKGASDKAKEMARAALPERANISISMVEAALGSIADRAIVPMQDILWLGSEARMNTPGTVGGRNWLWRMPQGSLTSEMATDLREMNEFFERV